VPPAGVRPEAPPPGTTGENDCTPAGIGGGAVGQDVITVNAQPNAVSGSFDLFRAL